MVKLFFKTKMENLIASTLAGLVSYVTIYIFRGWREKEKLTLAKGHSVALFYFLLH